MATEFIVTVNKTGEDYGDPQSAESALQADITAATVKVFSHGGITGTVGDGASVTGQTSAATGTVCHATSTQIMIKAISGTFSSGEVVQVSSGNSVTISDAGDSVKPVISCFSTDGVVSGNLTIDGSTCDATNFITVTGREDKHGGVYGSGFIYTQTGSSGDVHVDIGDDYAVVEWITIKQQTTYLYGGGAASRLGASYGTLRYCFVVMDATDSTRDLVWINNNNVQYIYRNVVIGIAHSNRGIFCDTFGAHQCQVHNNTVYGCGGAGFDFPSGSGTSVLKNNVSCGNTGSDYNVHSNNTQDYNADEDGTATGANSITIVVANALVDVSTYDFHIKAGSDLIDAGVTLGSPYDDFDIDYVAPTGTMDIGADHYVSSGTTVSPSAQALTLALPAPTIVITASPSAQALTLALPAPTISVGSNTTVSPSAQALTLALPTPTIVITASPSAQTLTLALPVPTIVVTASPSAQTLTLALPVPTVSIATLPSVQTLTVSQLAPGVVIDVIVTPSAQTLSLSQPAQTPMIGVSLSAIGISVGTNIPTVALPWTYTKEAIGSLPTDDTDLATAFSDAEYNQTLVDDSSRVDVTGLAYIVHLFKIKNTNSTDEISFSWNGQSSLAPSSATVYLQIYNRTSGSWESIDSESAAASDTDFSLTGSKTASLGDYYSGSNEVAARVYQYNG